MDILSVASLRGSHGTPDEEVWFAVARPGKGTGLHHGGTPGEDGNVCLDACTEAVVQGEKMAGLGHLAGCGALLLDGEGACLPVSVDGKGNAACPGRLDGETVTVNGRSGGEDDAPGDA